MMPSVLAPSQSLSRRILLGGVLALASAWACEAGNPSRRGEPSTGSAGSARSAAAASAPQAASPLPAAPAPATPPPATSSGLEVVRLGPMPESERGGQLVLLLHGWGAPGDNLVSLARTLGRPRTRFLVPAAPLPEPGGGRAWWHLGKERPAKVSTDELPARHQPSAAVAEARRAVQALLREAVQRYAPDSIALAGFSQGAQLALDVALAAEPRVDRVAVLSGALLADSLAALHATQPPLPAVFVAHGRTDRVLAYSGAEGIQSVLSRRGYSVTFFPFDGGHQIPPIVVEQLRTFLFVGPG